MPGALEVMDHEEIAQRDEKAIHVSDDESTASVCNITLDEHETHISVEWLWSWAMGVALDIVFSCAFSCCSLHAQ